MKHLGPEWQMSTRSNRLVVEWYNPDTMEYLRQGKRVGQYCPLSAEERRIYVERGLVHLLSHMRGRGISLPDAFHKIRVAEGHRTWTDAN